MVKISVKNFDKFNENASLNNRTYDHYFTRLKMLATTMYKWEGLPTTISKRFIENNLFYYGKLAFFKSKKFGYIVTKCASSGLLNIYDEPIVYHCYGNNGFNEDVKAEDCVIIRNNIDELPTSYFIEMFCQRLYEIRRTMDVNIKQQKTPLLVLCEESQRLTMKNLFMKYEGNEPVIFGNKNIDLEGVKVLKTDAPFIADKLFSLKNEEWKECLEMLGINNANTHKKERLNVDEVNSNNQLIALESDIMLMTRQFACEEIKGKFDIDVSVELREGMNSTDSEEGDMGE